jgi:SH3-like domain-containing protein
LTPTPTLTPTATPAPTFNAEVGVELANLREGPGSDYPVVVILGQGEGLLLTARNAAGDWFYARTALGQEGWIFNETLLLHDDILLLPGRITPTPFPTTTPESS